MEQSRTATPPGLLLFILLLLLPSPLLRTPRPRVEPTTLIKDPEISDEERGEYERRIIEQGLPCRLWPRCKDDWFLITLQPLEGWEFPPPTGGPEDEYPLINVCRFYELDDVEKWDNFVSRFEGSTEVLRVSHFCHGYLGFDAHLDEKTCPLASDPYFQELQEIGSVVPIVLL